LFVYYLSPQVTKLFKQFLLHHVVRNVMLMRKSVFNPITEGILVIWSVQMHIAYINVA
jgi:hypothetical protein